MEAVAVAMSGGVDSSVAAALLRGDGFPVLGVTFRLFGCEQAGRFSSGCCGMGATDDARKVAEQLGIEHVVVDFSHLFRRHVIGPFVESYRKGETPNPCVLCNQHIKFAALVDFAATRGCSAVATGHYARVGRAGERLQLLKGVDPAKDQSYFLFPLDQGTLPRVRFPVGALRKTEVRALAAEMGLPVAAKAESQEICFAPDGSYVAYLEAWGGLSPNPGEVVLEDGTVIGEHQGLHRHTIGQRKGLGFGHGRPLYVIARDVAANRLVVGPKESLACAGVVARAPVWTAGEIPPAGATLGVRIRYRSRETAAVVETADESGFGLRFSEPVLGVAAGQAAVLYRGEEVVGGGWIARTIGPATK